MVEKWKLEAVLDDWEVLVSDISSANLEDVMRYTNALRRFLLISSDNTANSLILQTVFRRLDKGGPVEKRWLYIS